MAAFNKFNAWVQNLCNGNINLASDTCKVMLTNTAPVASNSLYGDISANEIAGGGTTGYTVGGASITAPSSTQTSGTETFTGTIASPTWTAGASGMGPFRYVVVYDSTPSSPNKPLIGWWDYGASLTLTNGQTFTVAIATGIFTLQ
jgi:hypothetical protein